LGGLFPWGRGNGDSCSSGVGEASKGRGGVTGVGRGPILFANDRGRGNRGHEKKRRGGVDGKRGGEGKLKRRGGDWTSARKKKGNAYIRETTKGSEKKKSSSQMEKPPPTKRGNSSGKKECDSREKKRGLKERWGIRKEKRKPNL